MSQVKEFYCHNCGAKVTTEMEYCNVCGAKLILPEIRVNEHTPLSKRKSLKLKWIAAFVTVLFVAFLFLYKSTFLSMPEEALNNVPLLLMPGGRYLYSADVKRTDSINTFEAEVVVDINGFNCYCPMLILGTNSYVTTDISISLSGKGTGYGVKNGHGYEIQLGKCLGKYDY